MKGLIQSQCSLSCSSLILFAQTQLIPLKLSSLFSNTLNLVSAGKFYQYKLGYEIEN